MPKFYEEKSKRKLDILRKKEEEESTKIISQKYGIPYVNLGTFPIEIDALMTVPEDHARTAELAVIQMTGKHLRIAVKNPQKEETVAVLKQLEEERYTHELFLASKSSLEHAWEVYQKAPERYKTTAGIVEIHNEHLTALQKEIRNIDEVKSLVEKAFFGKTTEILEIVLAGAVALGASDIHLEPQEERVRLRFRLDGVLYDVIFLPPKVFKLLLSRIKLVAELKLNIRDKAQDGRFTIRIEDTDVEVRVSSLPGPYGENIVMRILNPNTIQINFEDMGMQPWIMATMEEELKKPNGMILTTGPTGSGKTTTLYAAVRKVHNPGTKIITVEDPIEYHLKGIEQTQVDSEKGYDFANALRAIVRQDPDVILVGEIRDLETASIAMHAALTGHLVFSTLHTNNAAGTIPRLLDLGIKPPIIAPAINVSMAQRLLRKLCGFCKQELKPTEEFLKKLQQELAGFPKAIPVPDQKDWKLFKAAPQGCPKCNNTGYKGRIGVFEIILIDDEIERLVLKGESSEYEMQKQAFRQGQITMRQDGLLRVLTGMTDLEEIESVVGNK